MNGIAALNPSCKPRKRSASRKYDIVSIILINYIRSNDNHLNFNDKTSL